MPELPEVETVRSSIASRIIGSKISKVLVYQPKLRQLISRNLKKILTGQKILSITRRGKYLLLHTTCGTIIIHLGMSGRLLILPTKHQRNKHEHVTVFLDNGKALCFIDPRRFGLFLWTDKSEHPLLKKLGKEPLAQDFTGDYLFQLSRKRKITIKQFIMDNHIVTGIGNIYASEILFAAKIPPTLPANKISKKQAQILVAKTKSILKLAIKKRGTTFRDYVDGSGMHGNFQKYLKVYGRDGEPCLICKTPLSSTRLGQRATVYCPKCQKGNKKQQFFICISSWIYWKFYLHCFAPLAFLYNFFIIHQ